MASGTGLTWPAVDLAEAAALLRRGEVSAAELVEAHLDRVARLDGTLRACVTVTSDEARDAARAADERRASLGEDASDLLGLPLALKDNFETAGVRTTAGSPALAGWVPEHDAACVARLRRAGAAFVGKVNLDEFAMGGQSANPIGGATRNPWDAESVPGGSSGGSGAAVAASMCMAATGSDTGGSIRNPSAWCGVTGLKPTFGAIDPAGVVPLCWSLDTVGFLARTVADCALLFAETADALEGASPAARRAYARRAAAPPDRRPRLGVAVNVADLAEPDIRGGFAAVVERLGATADVEPVELPRVDDAMLATLITLLSEGAAAWESGLRTGWAAYGPPVRGLLDLGRLVSATEYIQAQRAREGIRRAVATLFERYDALIMPCMGISPRPGVFDDAGDVGAVGPDSLMWRLEARFTCMWNLTGCPVVSIPCAFTPSGYPFAMQVVTPPGADELALRVASLAEATLAIPRADLVPTWVRETLAGPGAAGTGAGPVGTP